MPEVARDYEVEVNDEVYRFECGVEASDGHVDHVDVDLDGVERLDGDDWTAVRPDARLARALRDAAIRKAEDEVDSIAEDCLERARLDHDEHLLDWSLEGCP